MGKAWIEFHESRLGLPLGAKVTRAEIRSYPAAFGDQGHMVRLLVEHPDLPETTPPPECTVFLETIRQEARFGPIITDDTVTS